MRGRRSYDSAVNADDGDDPSASAGSAGTPQGSDGKLAGPSKLTTQVLVHRQKSAGQDVSDSDEGGAGQQAGPASDGTSDIAEVARAAAEPHAAVQQHSQPEQSLDGAAAHTAAAAAAAEGTAAEEETTQSVGVAECEAGDPASAHHEEEGVSDVESDEEMAEADDAAEDEDKDEDDDRAASLEVYFEHQPQADAAAAAANIISAANMVAQGASLNAAGEDQVGMPGHGDGPNLREVVEQANAIPADGPAGGVTSAATAEQQALPLGSLHTPFREFSGSRPSETGWPSTAAPATPPESATSAGALAPPATSPIVAPTASLQCTAVTASQQPPASEAEAPHAAGAAGEDGASKPGASNAEEPLPKPAGDPLQPTHVSSGPCSMDEDEDIDITSLLLEGTEVEVLHKQHDKQLWRPATLAESLPAGTAPDAEASVMWRSDATHAAHAVPCSDVRPVPPPEHTLASLSEVRPGGIIEMDLGGHQGYRKVVIICLAHPSHPVRMPPGRKLAAALGRIEGMGSSSLCLICNGPPDNIALMTCSFDGPELRSAPMDFNHNMASCRPLTLCASSCWLTGMLCPCTVLT